MLCSGCLLTVALSRTDQAGRAELGEHNIIPNYFEQNQAEALDLEETVLGTLEKASPDSKIDDIKRLLGQMMFSGKSMEKQVGNPRSCFPV